MRSLSPSPHSRQLPFTSPAGTESGVGLPAVPTASTRTVAVTRSTTRTLVDRNMVAVLLTIDPISKLEQRVAVCERVRMNGSKPRHARQQEQQYSRIAKTFGRWRARTGSGPTVTGTRVAFKRSFRLNFGASKMSPDSCILFFSVYTHTPHKTNMADGGDEEVARVLSPGTVIEKPQHHFPPGEKPSKKKKSVAPKASAKVCVCVHFLQVTKSCVPLTPLLTLCPTCVCVCVCVCQRLPPLAETAFESHEQWPRVGR
jgi:hypothetical protein